MKKLHSAVKKHQRNSNLMGQRWGRRDLLRMIKSKIFRSIFRESLFQYCVT